MMLKIPCSPEAKNVWRAVDGSSRSFPPWFEETWTRIESRVSCQLLDFFGTRLRKQKAAAAIRKWALRLFPDDGYVNYYQAPVETQMCCCLP